MLNLDTHQSIAQVYVMVVHIMSCLQWLQQLAMALQSRSSVTDAAANFVDAHGDSYRVPIDLIPDVQVSHHFWWQSAYLKVAADVSRPALRQFCRQTRPSQGSRGKLPITRFV